MNHFVETEIADKIEIITINVGFRDTETRANQFIQKNDLKYPVLFDTQSQITQEHNVTGVPTVLISDQSGNILFRNHYVPNQDDINRMFP